MISDEEDEDNIETSFIDLNYYGVMNFDDSNIDDIKNMSSFGRMNNSISNRKLNSSNHNEKSFRNKNSKIPNNNEDKGNLKIKIEGKTNTKDNNIFNIDNLDEKNKIECFDKQKIIEINEEEDERSHNNSFCLNNQKQIVINCNDENLNKDKERLLLETMNNEDKNNFNINSHEKNNLKKNIINPLEKFEKFYLKEKQENNKVINKNLELENNRLKLELDQIKNANENKLNNLYNKNEDINKKNNQNSNLNDKEINEFHNKYVVTDIEQEEYDIENINNEDNGEIEELFNNFENQTLPNGNSYERYISKEDMNKMDKDDLIKMILNSDFVNENNKMVKYNAEKDIVNNLDNKLKHDNNEENREANKINDSKQHKFSFNPRKKNIDDINSNLINEKHHQNHNKINNDTKNNLNTNKAIDNKQNNHTPKMNKNHNNFNNKENNQIASTSKINNNQGKPNLNKKVNLQGNVNNLASPRNKEIPNKLDKKSDEKICISNQLNNIDQNLINNDILDEIVEKKEELDSQQILEMLMYNKNKLEDEISQVYLLYIL